MIVGGAVIFSPPGSPSEKQPAFRGVLACKEEGASKSDLSFDEILSGDISLSELEDTTRDAEYRLKVLRNVLEEIAPNRPLDLVTLYKNRFYRTDRSFFFEIEREGFPLETFLRVFAEKSEEHHFGKMLVFVSLKISQTEPIYRVRKFFIESGGYEELKLYE